jgi:NAD(P)-dependent dehydrogenase (short-subunit alcohol dehydrogenase family)
MARALPSERRAEILKNIRSGRFVEVDEIARMVAFLCSDDCSSRPARFSIYRAAARPIEDAKSLLHIR